MAFPCEACGRCCQHVRSLLDDDGRPLDRGDGTCKHYEPVTKKCLIYDVRPLICRIDALYEVAVRPTGATRMEWYEANIEGCRELQALPPGPSETDPAPGIHPTDTAEEAT